MNTPRAFTPAPGQGCTRNTTKQAGCTSFAKSVKYRGVKRCSERRWRTRCYMGLGYLLRTTTQNPMIHQMMTHMVGNALSIFLDTLRCERQLAEANRN